MILIALGLAVAAPAACPSQATLPALKNWATPTAGSTVSIGQPARLTLSAGQVFPSTTHKGARPVGLGAASTFRVDQQGIYEVALSEAAWVDVIGHGQAMESSAHRHGPDCTSIRKIVAFPLKPGSYTLQLSGSAKADVTVAIYRVDP